MTYAEHEPDAVLQEQPDFIDLSHAKARFGVSQEWLADAIRAGDLAGVKPGRKWLVVPGDVKDLIYARDAERAEREGSTS